ncbi:hypothetical protein MNBD_GAMMA21-998 [hydrothermal vent metagenome]|uniref:YfaZ n=1 Tax=hydrothermal vent metagenome TaxID=652676 RepID=A0A3B1A457_9ZZZZ
MYRRFIFILVALFLSQIVRAESLNIQLGDNSARVMYATEVIGGSFGPTDLEVGAYYNNDKDKLFHLGLLIRNNTLDNPLIIGFGTRLYYADVGNQSGQNPATASAVALGGEVLYVPDAFNGFGIGFNYFYAPSVLTFQDGDGFSEYGAIGSYAVSKQARFYVGYRFMELRIENASDIEVDSGFIFGFNLRF